MDLLTRFSCAVGEIAETGRRRACHTDSMQLHRKQPPESRLKKFERDPTVGSIVMVLLTRFSSAVGGMAPTGRRQRVVPIPHNSIENRLRKLVKKI